MVVHLGYYTNQTNASVVVSFGQISQLRDWKYAGAITDVVLC
jgi:hypothetical protein